MLFKLPVNRSGLVLETGDYYATNQRQSQGQLFHPQHLAPALEQSKKGIILLRDPMEVLNQPFSCSPGSDAGLFGKRLSGGNLVVDHIFL